MRQATAHNSAALCHQFRHAFQAADAAGAPRSRCLCSEAHSPQVKTGNSCACCQHKDDTKVDKSPSITLQCLLRFLIAFTTAR